MCVYPLFIINKDIYILTFMRLLNFNKKHVQQMLRVTDLSNQGKMLKT